MPTTQKPRFAVIKAFLRDKVESREWAVGLRIPTEQALTEMFSVSRMTARRAVQELTAEGFFTRKPGLGTFVSDPSNTMSALKIVNLVEMAQRKGSHGHRLLSIDRMEVDTETAAMMQLAPRTAVGQLTLVHLDNNQPIQWQRISVNLAFAPALLKQKWDKIVPDAYLNWIAPPTSVQYQLKAVTPRASQVRELALTQQSHPVCIQLTRKHWSGSEVISVSRMLHDAESYSLGDAIDGC
jgi:GntR family histidine utilization transcriptional repressor